MEKCLQTKFNNMKWALIVLLSISICRTAVSQRSIELPFGDVSYADLKMKSFPRDTSASAFVINEIGKAHINDDEILVFEYYVKIKILNRNGFGQADFSIPLHKENDKKEELTSVKASTYNFNGGGIQESKMDIRTVYTQNANKYTDLKSLHFPIFA